MSSQVKLNNNIVHIDGDIPQKGSQAVNFTLTPSDLGSVSLSNYDGKCKILNIFPSVDTGVCATSVRNFNKEANSLNNTIVLCISADLPFAQSRFCGAEGLNNVVMLSTFRSLDFKKNYGVDIKDSKLAGLCARAVIVLDENNKVLHSQLVSPISDEPDYKSALAVL